MSFNEQPSSERLRIGFFGLTNAGKSSLVNAVTGQTLSIVSPIMGTTTDPVKKAMELLPLGPVVIIDTPGFDDNGALGELRIKRTRQVLCTVDLAILVSDCKKHCTKSALPCAPASHSEESEIPKTTYSFLEPAEKELIALFQEKEIPYLIAYSKADLLEELPLPQENEIYVSAQANTNIYELKERIGQLIKQQKTNRRIVADLIRPGDFVILVTPIDSAAPKGRLILPQQQTIRDLLDAGAIPVVTRETELPTVLSGLSQKPSLIITDSQAFERVSKEVPSDLALTSFSILFARYKGDLPALVQGADALKHLKDGDRILICEGCTHHRQCGDIGTVKLPEWIRQFSKTTLDFTFTSGTDFPEELSSYALIIHCGGCMLTEREMRSRMHDAKKAQIPMTNYGTAIAQMHGILDRALNIFSLERH